jgi:hypothetical protein
MTFFDRVLLAAMLGLFPLLASEFYFLAIGGFPGGLRGSLIVAAAISAFVYGLAESRISVRRVDISESGISFRYLFHSEYGSWSDLGPSPSFPVWHGMWQIQRRQTPTRLKPPLRGHLITVEQLRAVLTYPGCPHWALPESVERELRQGDARVIARGS